MQAKRFILDFLCSFFIFTLLLFSIVIISEHNLLDGAFSFDRASGSVGIFGYRFFIDKRVPSLLYSVFKFNDTLFANGFCAFLQRLFDFVFTLLCDIFKITYEIILKTVGGK